ncbi:MAG: hypothetical protein JWQ94_2621 [Tardiphaga sp.]|nr:hypothetical protein [Tardiphaga sp.]
MNEATLILPNMRGGCATVGNTVHTLFRITSRRPRAMACPVEQDKTADQAAMKGEAAT